jgi:predicted MFS family arabinose efflux permease
LPTLASPLAGVLADRLDRRAVLVACDLARAALVLGAVFARDLALLYAISFLMGAARTLFNPTIRAAFPSVVGSGDLTRANALISGTFSISFAVGPALGGLLVAYTGVEAAFVLDAATYLVSAAFLALIPLPRPQREDGESFTGELRAGFRYLAGAQVPLAIVVGAFLTMLAVTAMVPAEVFLAKVTFEAGDAGYGLLVGTWGAAWSWAPSSWPRWATGSPRYFCTSRASSLPLRPSRGRDWPPPSLSPWVPSRSPGSPTA